MMKIFKKKGKETKELKIVSKKQQKNVKGGGSKGGSIGDGGIGEDFSGSGPWEDIY